MFTSRVKFYPQVGVNIDLWPVNSSKHGNLVNDLVHLLFSTHPRHRGAIARQTRLT